MSTIHERVRLKVDVHEGGLYDVSSPDVPALKVNRTNETDALVQAARTLGDIFWRSADDPVWRIGKDVRDGSLVAFRYFEGAGYPGDVAEVLVPNEPGPHVFARAHDQEARGPTTEANFDGVDEEGLNELGTFLARGFFALVQGAGHAGREDVRRLIEAAEGRKAAETMLAGKIDALRAEVGELSTRLARIEHVALGESGDVRDGIESWLRNEGPVPAGLEGMVDDDPDILPGSPGGTA